MYRKISTIILLLAVGILIAPAQSASTLITQNPPIADKSNAPEWAWTGWQRPDGINPVISPRAESEFLCPMQKRPMKWEESDTFNPAATVINGKVVVLYRAEDNSATGIGARTSRIGYAISDDGLHFTRRDAPVLFPDAGDGEAENECPGGCEDPRVCMTEGGVYVMMYTQWNRKQARLGVATSRDLVTWTKHGSPFAQAYGGKFARIFSKSASIVTKMKGDQLVAAKINGKYWMYWGEQFVNVATSDDLIHWTPMVDGNGDLLRVIEPRKGYFDSQLTECGPPAILTKHGILLMYNGKNRGDAQGDKRYTPNSYCAGQVLFSDNEPSKVLGRLDIPFFIPEASFEKSGQYPSGTVFIEGLVPHDGKWFLYYGCADSRVSVAVRPMKEQHIAPFRKGDRVAFVGNSITDGGHYHSYIWLYYMTHFPTMRVWMDNCGIGGDTSHEILRRLEGDVMQRKPTVVTLTFGMNDTGYYEFNGDNPQAHADSRVARASACFDTIQHRLLDHPEMRKIMIGTSPYDDTSRFNNDVFRNKNAAMQRIVSLQEKAAKNNGWDFVDFNAPMTAINREFQQRDSAFTLCGSDRVHPDNDGHMVMAYLFLKAQGLVGQKVADVCIDASTRKVLRSGNCKLSAVKGDASCLTFDYLAQSLPYPLDRIAHGWGFNRPQEDVLKVLPSLPEELSDERLAVQGLEGRYCLTIDDVCLDTLDASQLAVGVNLARYHLAPQYQQALTVMALNERRWDIEQSLRQWAWIRYNFLLERGLENATNAEIESIFWKACENDAWLNGRKDTYMKMIHPEVRQAEEERLRAIVDKIYEVNRPVRRHIALTRIVSPRI